MIIIRNLFLINLFLISISLHGSETYLKILNIWKKDKTQAFKLIQESRLEPLECLSLIQASNNIRSEELEIASLMILYQGFENGWEHHGGIIENLIYDTKLKPCPNFNAANTLEFLHRLRKIIEKFRIEKQTRSKSKKVIEAEDLWDERILANCIYIYRKQLLLARKPDAQKQIYPSTNQLIEFSKLFYSLQKLIREDKIEIGDLIRDSKLKPTDCVSLLQISNHQSDESLIIASYAIFFKSLEGGWEHYGDVVDKLLINDESWLESCLETTHNHLMTLRTLVAEANTKTSENNFDELLKNANAVYINQKKLAFLTRKSTIKKLNTQNISQPQNKTLQENNTVQQSQVVSEESSSNNTRKSIKENYTHEQNQTTESVQTSKNEQQNQTSSQSCQEQPKQPETITKTSFSPISNFYLYVSQLQPKQSMWDKYKYWTIPAALFVLCIPPYVMVHKAKKLANILYDPSAWVNQEKKLINKQFLAKSHTELINEWLPIIMQKYKSDTHKHAVEKFLFDIEEEVKTLKKYILKANFFRGLGLGTIFGFYEDMFEMAERKLEIALFLEDHFRQWLIQENQRILVAMHNVLHII